MDKKYEKEFQHDKQYFKPPSLDALKYLARDAVSKKPVTPQEHYAHAVELHKHLHLGEFETCPTSHCVAARQLKIKASDYYISMGEPE